MTGIAACRTAHDHRPRAGHQWTFWSQRWICVAVVLAGLLASAQPASAVAPITLSPARAPTTCAEGATPHQVLFVADDGVRGSEPWVTDGTPEGTHIVKDVNPAGPSDPQLIGTMDGVVYFFADDGVHGREPWRSDGSEAGTWLLADLRETTRGSAPSGSRASVVVGDRLLFVAQGRRARPSLWSTDGTTEGTQRLDGFPFSGPMAHGDDVAYRLSVDEEGEADVWRSDGTTAGTWRLPDARPLIVHADPMSARDHVVSARSYSVERDDMTGWEAWSGEGLPEVDEVFMYDGYGADLMPITILGGRLLFYLDDGDGHALWTSDGSPDGTAEIAPVGPRRSFHEMPEALAFLGDRAILLAEDRQGPALWVTDGTAAGTRRLSDLRWADREHMSWVVPVVVDGRVFFEARSKRHGRQVWTTDGTVGGTRRLTDLPRGSRPVELAAVGGKVYIGVTTARRRSQVWTSDGTRRGTRLLRELPAHPISWTTPVFLEGSGKRVLFVHPMRMISSRRSGETETAVFGLSISDGTRRGTRTITGVELHAPGQGPAEQAWQLAALRESFAPIAVDGLIYFRNPAPAQPERFAGLWRSDGSARGTERVSPIVPSTFLAAIAPEPTCSAGRDS